MADQAEEILPLLKKIATENNFKSYDIKVKPISTGGANFSSQLYLAHISGDGHDDLRLFVKKAVMGEKIREQCASDPYDNERFIYTDLLAAYKQLEDENGISEEHRLRYPKYYGVDMSYLNEVLVLEDLSSQGFLLQDRTEPVDWEYASAAITQLSRFHALSFAYELKNPEKFKENLSRYPRTLFSDTEGGRSYYKSTVETALTAVKEQHRALLKSFLDRYSMVEYGNFYGTKRRPVLIHGDFRPSNMLHRYREDGTVELIPVDYQTLMYGSPVLDLLYFIFTATDGSSRALMYNKLVKHYYSELSSALDRLGLRAHDVYPEEEFREELKEKLPFGLLISSLMLSLLLVDESDAPKIDLDMDMADLTVTATSDLYKKRLNEVVDDYIAWGILA